VKCPVTMPGEVTGEVDRSLVDGSEAQPLRYQARLRGYPATRASPRVLSPRTLARCPSSVSRDRNGLPAEGRPARSPSNSSEQQW
jgi:hypothetical protein